MTDILERTQRLLDEVLKADRQLRFLEAERSRVAWEESRDLSAGDRFGSLHRAANDARKDYVARRLELLEFVKSLEEKAHGVQA